MNDLRVGRRLLVRGRVQGVGFRYFVFQRASFLGVNGWVRNNHDGSVEIEAWGNTAQLAEFEVMVRQGPRSARVDDVVSRNMPESSPPSDGFSIRGW